MKVQKQHTTYLFKNEEMGVEIFLTINYSTNSYIIKNKNDRVDFGFAGIVSPPAPIAGGKPSVLMMQAAVIKLIAEAMNFVDEELCRGAQENACNVERFLGENKHT